MRATLGALMVLVVLCSRGHRRRTLRPGRQRAECTRRTVCVGSVRGARRTYLATPRAVRGRSNPVEANDAVFNEGLEHFADHCATCHGNDGSGDTAIGRNLYPRAPDMRTSRTQDLSDGELFSIIENGVRLTGMPAWGDGTPESEQASWVLVALHPANSRS